MRKINLIKYILIKYKFIVIFEHIELKNKMILLKCYLNKWINKINAIEEKFLKLVKAMDEINKKLLFNKYINTISDVFLIKRFKEAIPLVRAFNFFDKLIDRNNTLQKYLYELVYHLDIKKTEILRKKIKQWLLKVKNGKEENCKNIIARWTKERYRIKKARNNWRKFVDLYNLFNKKKALGLINKLIIFMKLKKAIIKINRYKEYYLLKNYLKIWLINVTKIKNNEYEKKNFRIK